MCISSLPKEVYIQIHRIVHRSPVPDCQCQSQHPHRTVPNKLFNCLIRLCFLESIYPLFTHPAFTLPAFTLQRFCLINLLIPPSSSYSYFHKKSPSQERSTRNRSRVQTLQPVLLPLLLPRRRRRRPPPPPPPRQPPPPPRPRPPLRLYYCYCGTKHQRARAPSSKNSYHFTIPVPLPI